MTRNNDFRLSSEMNWLSIGTGHSGDIHAASYSCEIPASLKKYTKKIRAASGVKLHANSRAASGTFDQTCSFRPRNMSWYFGAWRRRSAGWTWSAWTGQRSWPQCRQKSRSQGRRFGPANVGPRWWVCCPQHSPPSRFCARISPVFQDLFRTSLIGKECLHL